MIAKTFSWEQQPNGKVPGQQNKGAVVTKMQICQCGDGNIMSTGLMDHCSWRSMWTDWTTECDWRAWRQMEEFIIKTNDFLFFPHMKVQPQLPLLAQRTQWPRPAGSSLVSPALTKIWCLHRPCETLWDLFQMYLPQLTKTTCNAQINK